MFELNLIKDKALARKRRRLIFMTIVSVLLFSGLVAIFVGSLFWQELTATNRLRGEIASLSNAVQQMEDQIKIEKPMTQRRRNALINAWLEDKEVLESSRAFSPVFRELYEKKPRTEEFWYNSIQIETPRQGGARSTTDQWAHAAALLRPRNLTGNGYIQIQGSDVVTENELEVAARSMGEVLKLMGRPSFTVDFSKKPDEAAAEGGVYVPFTISASTTTFTGGNMRTP